MQRQHPHAEQVIRVSAHEFDWGDAGIGAAAGVGLSMLGVGGSLLSTGARRDNRRPTRLTMREER